MGKLLHASSMVYNVFFPALHVCASVTSSYMVANISNMLIVLVTFCVLSHAVVFMYLVMNFLLVEVRHVRGWSVHEVLSSFFCRMSEVAEGGEEEQFLISICSLF